MVKTVTIGDRVIGKGHPCFVIAEAGVNHNGSLDLALDLVRAAHKAGADAVKFQLFRVEEQISQGAPTAEYQRGHTGETTMTEMAKSYDLDWEAHREIAACCQDLGIQYMASCFDPMAVDFLLELGGLCIKVGSGEITNFPLLAYMAKTGKPILLSTGMSTWADVAQAVDLIRSSGESPLILFQCTSNYPAAPETINLNVMASLEAAFDVPIGYSDHTVDDVASVAAVALGACLIEKHFTLDQTLPGPDHAMSLDPDALTRFVGQIRKAEMVLGHGQKCVLSEEKPVQIVARRSLVSACEIRAGEKLHTGNVTLKRPATGIDPRLWEAVDGRVAQVDIPVDIPLTWDMLK